MNFVSEDVGHIIEDDKMLEGLKQMYVDLGYATDSTDFVTSYENYETYGTWTKFDQGDFVGVDSTLDKGIEWNWNITQWSDSGWVYIPDVCYSTTCKLHVAFHGCTQSAEDLNSYAGYNKFAATNNVIMVYPETFCWNIYGKFPEEPLWLTNQGLYPKAISAIICRMTTAEADNVCPNEATTLFPIALSLLIITTLSNL